MPIKLNGTTIIDETNLANKDLSNLSSAGSSVINNIATTAANQAIASANMLKQINFNNAVSFVASYSGGVSKVYTDYTTPSDGYFLITIVGNGYIISNKTYTIGNVLFPVKASTTIRTVVISPSDPASTTGWFFPQIS